MDKISQANSANKYFDTSVFVDPITIGRYQRGNTSYSFAASRAVGTLRRLFAPEELSSSGITAHSIPG